MSGPSPNGSYTLVHLVAGELMTNLIASQVIDHMAEQAATPGEGRPSRVVVGFLEPLRLALGSAARQRLRALRARAPGVRSVMLPYVSRYGTDWNASLVARRLRPLVDGADVVFHCRTELAARWAGAVRAALRRRGAVGRCGVVADVRGALAEETIYNRGYHALADADPETWRVYHGQLGQLHAGLAESGAVISVSPGMLDWLCAQGVDRQRMLYVPCCVSALAYSDEARRAARERLQLGDRLTFAYVGTITRYQHIDDGVLPFFRAARRAEPRAHLLAITNEPDKMRALAADAGLPADAVTALSVPQKEVAALLAGADCGLLLRAPAPINRLWQPTKLGEYLASGVPVIVSRGVGQVDRLVAEHDAGVAVDCFGVTQAQLDAEARRAVDALSRRGEAMRRSALALCASEFLWSTYVPRVREAYRRALAA